MWRLHTESVFYLLLITWRHVYLSLRLIKKEINKKEQIKKCENYKSIKLLEILSGKPFLCKMANYTQLSDYCNFNFVRVEDSPLMNPTSNIIIVSSACTILIVGILINGRIYKILSNHTDAAAVDKILKLNTIISLAMHSVILTFYIAASFLYPMSDYIGHVGCFLCVQVLDVFARFYNFMFPVAIALLRYLFVVKSLWVKAVGMKNVVNRIIAFSLFAPLEDCIFWLLGALMWISL